MQAAQIAIQRTLSEALTNAKIKNPAFSLRAFAKRLKINPSALSEILNGKRCISEGLAKRLVDNLALDPKSRQSVLSLFEPETQDEKKSDNYLELSVDQFKVISEWYHFAILSLAETEGFQSDVKWVAERLKIKVQEVQHAVERLLRLRMLVLNPDGSWVVTGAQYRSSDEVTNLALRKAHAQNMELAMKSLDEDAVDSRDFTAMTMAIDAKKLPIAKKMIREFLDKLSVVLESGYKSEVYKASIQLIPLTRIKEEV